MTENANIVPPPQEEFEGMIASFLVADYAVEPQFAPKTAKTILEEYLNLCGVAYGNSQYDWDRAAAKEMTDESMMEF